jgi:hypothetical protein
MKDTQQLVRFVPSPNGPIVVADVRPGVIGDELAGRRLRIQLGRALGDVPVILRCRHNGASFSLDGERNLWSYAVHPTIDLLPAVGIDLNPPATHAA